MSATLATRTWSLPPDAPRASPWRFGQEVLLTGVPGTPPALQWLLPRNCSLAPRQVGLAYAGLSAVSLAIAAFFFVAGATLVIAFTGIELLGLGVALLIFARHAADRETLTLLGRSLQVDQRFGRHLARTEFAADWMTVEPAAGQGSLVELSGRGQTVRVGRFLRPELRAAFARELRLALRCPPTPDKDSN